MPFVTPLKLVTNYVSWQVWSVATGELVRHFNPETHYHNLQINRFCILAEIEFGPSCTSII